MELELLSGVLKIPDRSTVPNIIVPAPPIVVVFVGITDPRSMSDDKLLLLFELFIPLFIPISLLAFLFTLLSLLFVLLFVLSFPATLFPLIVL